MPKRNKKKWSRETIPVGCKARTGVSAVGPLGYGCQEKRKKEWPRGMDPLATIFIARPEPDSKGLLGAGTTKQSRGQKEPTDGLECQHGTVNVEPKRGSQCEASGRQYGTIDSSNS